MKNLLTIASILLLVSCGDTKHYSVSITNDSSKVVLYDYNGISDTLAVSETKTYEVEAYTQPPKNITDQDGIASVKIKRKGDVFTCTDFNFDEDNLPLILNVRNNLPVDVTIEADNFIDNNGSKELPIALDTESTGALIYTNNPIFTATFDTTIWNYPISIEKTIVENEMYVIIQ